MDWQRLAEEVERQRGRIGYGSRREFAEATHFAEKTLGDVENARRDTYSRVTMARLEAALQWPPGTVDAILRGTTPPPDPNSLPRHDDPPNSPTIPRPLGTPIPTTIAELIEMVAPDSPVPPQLRASLLRIVDAAMEQGRPYMARARKTRPDG